MSSIATDNDKDQADANATNAQPPPPAPGLAPPGPTEPKKSKKKKHKPEGDRVIGPAEDILPARPEQSMQVTHPGSATSATSNGAPLPPDVQPASGAVPTAPFSDSAAAEPQGQDIQEPTAVAHRETIEGKPPKCDAPPGETSQ
ncbi:basic proline-rich protein-like isoform X2 [Ornithodoros turicata]|uniref:basic proline-rich protein-like isoform X2 n=1 Tax=Ornithodoros turicata TaxID=34597 RepID=UPI003138EEC5